MLEYRNDKVTITCDKCGKTTTAPEGIHNDIFYAEGWGMNPRGKKYKHQCARCLARAGKDID